VTALLLSVGVPVGVWLAFFYRYAWSDHFEVLGFPIPVLVFELEDGKWVDYVGNPILAFVSLFLVVSAFLEPVSAGLLVAPIRAHERLEKFACSGGSRSPQRQLCPWIADFDTVIRESVPNDNIVSTSGRV